MAVTRKTNQKSKPDDKSKGKGGSSGGGSMSKADAFSKTKAAAAIANGKYEGVIKEFINQKPDEKGHSARVTFLVCSEGDEQGNTVTQWYKMFDTDDQPCKGLEFLKRDLAILGYDDMEFDDLDEIFEEIVEKKIPVLFTVKHNEGFVNAYLGGLCEDSEIVAEYLEKNPY